MNLPLNPRRYDEDDSSPEDRLKELELKSFSMIRLGTVSAVNYSQAKIRVTTGDNTTKLIPWVTLSGSKVSVWRPPTIGESALLLSEDGNLVNAIAILGLYSTANPAQSDNENLHRVAFSDGTTFSYNTDTKECNLNLETSGTLNISCGEASIVMTDGRISLTGGNASLVLEDSITANGDTINLN